MKYFQSSPLLEYHDHENIGGKQLKSHDFHIKVSGHCLLKTYWEV